MQRFDLNQNWEYLESSLQNPLMVGMLQGWKKTSLPHDYAVEKARSPEAATGLDEALWPAPVFTTARALPWSRKSSASASGWNLKALPALPRSG